MRTQNPWLSIWTNPRATISSIVSENPKKGIWLLAWIYGFLSLLNAFQSLALGNTISLIPIVILALIIAPLWGMAIFGIWGWVVYAVGKLLKGQGSFSTVRAAYAWSCVPLVISIVLWVFLLYAFGLPLFQSVSTGQPIHNAQIALLFGVLIAKVLLAIWSLVIFINALAEVQQFSVIRAILNIVLSWVAIAVVIGILWWGLSSLHLANLFQLNYVHLPSPVAWSLLSCSECVLPGG